MTTRRRPHDWDDYLDGPWQGDDDYLMRGPSRTGVVAMGVRIVLNEDGGFRRLVSNPGELSHRFGCYDSEEDAVRAATFLFGPSEWAVRWSDHGWFYVEARAYQCDRCADQAERGW